MRCEYCGESTRRCDCGSPGVRPLTPEQAASLEASRLADEAKARRVRVVRVALTAPDQKKPWMGADGYVGYMALDGRSLGTPTHAHIFATEEEAMAWVALHPDVRAPGRKGSVRVGLLPCAAGAEVRYVE